MKRRNIKTALLLLLVFLYLSFILFIVAFSIPWLSFVNAVKVLEWANCPVPTDVQPLRDCGNYILNKFYYLTYGWIALIAAPAMFAYAFWDVLLAWVILMLIVLSIYWKYKNVN